MHGKEADSEISLREFISNIIVFLKRIYLHGDERITIELNIEDIRYSSKNATVLGIILHEIFVNAIKHAFPERKRGCVQLLLEEHDGVALLKCADNGTGLPEDFDMRADGSHGLSLISKLIRHFRGEMDIKRLNPGSEITLRFPLKS